MKAGRTTLVYANEVIHVLILNNNGMQLEAQGKGMTIQKQTNEARTVTGGEKITPKKWYPIR